MQGSGKGKPQKPVVKKTMAAQSKETSKSRDQSMPDLPAGLVTQFPAPGDENLIAMFNERFAGRSLEKPAQKVQFKLPIGRRSPAHTPEPISTDFSINLGQQVEGRVRQHLKETAQLQKQTDVVLNELSATKLIKKKIFKDTSDEHSKSIQQSARSKKSGKQPVAERPKPAAIRETTKIVPEVVPVVRMVEAPVEPEPRQFLRRLEKKLKGDLYSGESEEEPLDRAVREKVLAKSKPRKHQDLSDLESAQQQITKLKLDSAADDLDFENYVSDVHHLSSVLNDARLSHKERCEEANLKVKDLTKQFKEFKDTELAGIKAQLTPENKRKLTRAFSIIKKYENLFESLNQYREDIDALSIKVLGKLINESKVMIKTINKKIKRREKVLAYRLHLISEAKFAKMFVPPNKKSRAPMDQYLYEVCTTIKTAMIPYCSKTGLTPINCRLCCSIVLLNDDWCQKKGFKDDLAFSLRPINKIFATYGAQAFFRAYVRALHNNPNMQGDDLRNAMAACEVPYLYLGGYRDGVQAHTCFRGVDDIEDTTDNLAIEKLYLDTLNIDNKRLIEAAIRPPAYREDSEAYETSESEVKVEQPNRAARAFHRLSVKESGARPRSALPKIKREAGQSANRNRRATRRSATSSRRSRRAAPVANPGDRENLVFPRFCQGQWALRQPQLQQAGLRQLIVYGHDATKAPLIVDLTFSSGVFFLDVPPVPQPK